MSIIIKFVNQITVGLFLIFLVALVYSEKSGLIELIDRDAELVNNINATVAVNRSILDNIQEFDGNYDDYEDDDNSKLILITLDRKLYDRKGALEDEFNKLKSKIQNGYKEKESDEAQFFDGSNVETTKSSIILLAPLIFFAAFAGAIVQLLRDIQNRNNNGGAGKEDIILSQVLNHFVSGIGVAIICTLVFTVGTGEIAAVEKQTPDVISSFSKFGIPVKVLFSFLAGMFMNDMYHIIAKLIAKAKSKVP